MKFATACVIFARASASAVDLHLYERLEHRRVCATAIATTRPLAATHLPPRRALTPWATVRGQFYTRSGIFGHFAVLDCLSVVCLVIACVVLSSSYDRSSKALTTTTRDYVASSVACRRWSVFVVLFFARQKRQHITRCSTSSY